MPRTTKNGPEQPGKHRNRIDFYTFRPAAGVPVFMFCVSLKVMRSARRANAGPSTSLRIAQDDSFDGRGAAFPRVEIPGFLGMTAS